MISPLLLLLASRGPLRLQVAWHQVSWAAMAPKVVQSQVLWVRLSFRLSCLIRQIVPQDQQVAEGSKVALQVLRTIG
jgi:hypothetical protein